MMAELIQLGTTAAMTMLSVGLVFAFIRLVQGPSLPDRVVALDLISVIALALAAGYTLKTNSFLLLYPAAVLAVLALLAFLGTVAFARYIERRGGR